MAYRLAEFSDFGKALDFSDESRHVER